MKSHRWTTTDGQHAETCADCGVEAEDDAAAEECLAAEWEASYLAMLDLAAEMLLGQLSALAKRRKSGGDLIHATKAALAQAYRAGRQDEHDTAAALITEAKGLLPRFISAARDLDGLLQALPSCQHRDCPKKATRGTTSHEPLFCDDHDPGWAHRECDWAEYVRRYESRPKESR